MKIMLISIAAVIICFMINTVLGWTVLLAAAVYAIYTYFPAYYATKGNKAFQNNDTAGAVAWYKKAYDTGRANIMIKASYSFILMRAGEFEKAEAILNAILAERKVPPEKRNMAKQYRCMAIYKQGRLDEAIEDAEELFTEYKNTAMYGMVGYFKILSGQPLEDVLEFCEEAYDYNSDDRDILDNLSLVQYKLGNYEEAKRYSDELMANNPKFVEAFYHGALIAEKLGDIEKAKECIEQLEACRRSHMTTVSIEEIEALKNRIS